MITPKEYFGFEPGKKRATITPEEYFSGPSLQSRYQPTKATAWGAAKAVGTGVAKDVMAGVTELAEDVREGIPTWYRVPVETGEALGKGMMGFMDRYLGQIQSIVGQFARSGKVDWNAAYAVGKLREEVWHSDPHNPITQILLQTLGSVPEGIREAFHQVANLVAEKDPDSLRTKLADGLRTAGDLASEAAFMSVFHAAGTPFRQAKPELGTPQGPYRGERLYPLPREKYERYEAQRRARSGVQYDAEGKPTGEVFEGAEVGIPESVEGRVPPQRPLAQQQRAEDQAAFQKRSDQLVQDYLQREAGRALKPEAEGPKLPRKSVREKPPPRAKRPPTPEQYFGKIEPDEPLAALRIKTAAERKALEQDIAKRRKMEAQSFKRRKKAALDYLNWARQKNGLPTISGKYLASLERTDFAHRPPRDYRFQYELVDAIRSVYGRKEADAIQKIIEKEQAALGETGKPPAEQTVPYRNPPPEPVPRPVEELRESRIGETGPLSPTEIAEARRQLRQRKEEPPMEDADTAALLEGMRQKWEERQGEQYGAAMSASDRLKLLRERGKALQRIEKPLDPKMEAEKRAYLELREYEKELEGHPQEKSLLDMIADALLDESGSAQIVDSKFMEGMERWMKDARERGMSLVNYMMEIQRIPPDVAARFKEQYERNKTLPATSKDRAETFLEKQTTRRGFLKSMVKGAKMVAASGLMPYPPKISTKNVLLPGLSKISPEVLNKVGLQVMGKFSLPQKGFMHHFESVAHVLKELGIKVTERGIEGDLSKENLRKIENFLEEVGKTFDGTNPVVRASENKIKNKMEDLGDWRDKRFWEISDSLASKKKKDTMYDALYEEYYRRARDIATRELTPLVKQGKIKKKVADFYLRHFVEWGDEYGWHDNYGTVVDAIDFLQGARMISESFKDSWSVKSSRLFDQVRKDFPDFKMGSENEVDRILMDKGTLRFSDRTYSKLTPAEIKKNVQLLEEVVKNKNKIAREIKERGYKNPNSGEISLLASEEFPIDVVEVVNDYVINKIRTHTEGPLVDFGPVESAAKIMKTLERLRRGESVKKAARTGKTAGTLIEDALKMFQESENVRHEGYTEGWGHWWTDLKKGPAQGGTFMTKTKSPEELKVELGNLRARFAEVQSKELMDKYGLKFEGMVDESYHLSDMETGISFVTDSLKPEILQKAKAQAIRDLISTQKRQVQTTVVKDLLEGKRRELIDADKNDFGWVKLDKVKPDQLDAIRRDLDIVDIGHLKVIDGEVFFRTDGWTWAKAKYASTDPKLSQAERLVQTFGTTKDPRKSGWILEDGRMLELQKGDVWLDHDVVDWVTGENQYAAGTIPYVRVSASMPGSGILGIDLFREPTANQVKAINRIIKDPLWKEMVVEDRSRNKFGVFEITPGKDFQAYRRQLRSRESVTVDMLGLQTAWESASEYYRNIRAGRRGKVHDTLKQIRRQTLTSTPGNVLDRMATVFLDTKDFTKYLQNMPALGNLSPQEVWKLSENIQRQIAPLIKKQGVIKRVKGAIRKSGFYAVRSFATDIVGFKDISPRTNLLDPTRGMQQIDQGRFGGPAQRHILWPTRRNMLAKLLYIDQKKQRLLEIKERYNVNSKKKSKAIGELLELKPGDSKSYENIYRKWKIKPQDRQSLSSATADIRKLFNELLKDQNAARKKRNQKQIPFRALYRPWVTEANLWSRLGFTDRKPADVAEKPVPPDFIFPDRPFVPHTEARSALLKDYPKELDAIRLLSDYIESAGKDIFDTNTVQSNKIYSTVLKSQGLEHAARFVDNWTSEVFAGTLPTLSRWSRQSVHPGIRKGVFWLRRNLGRAVFPLNWTWNLFIQTSSAGLTVARYGVRDSLRAVDAFTDLKQAEAIRENAYSYIIKTRKGASPALQDLGDNLSKLRKLDSSRIDKATGWMNYLTRAVEEALTRHAVSAAYHQGRRIGLEGRALWEYASEGGAKTQSMYNFQDLPGLLRSRELTAVAPFQTFAMEVFNTVREMNVPALNRVVGKAGVTDTLLSQRLKMLARWTAAILVTNAVVDRAIGRKPWELSSFIPFYALLTGGYAAKGPIHHSYIQGFKNGVKGVVRHGNFKLLRRWFISYHTPGGIQINRMVEGIEAAVEGRVTDVAGKTQYKVTTPQEKRRAIFMGPSRTKEGKRRLRERRGLFFLPSTEKKSGLPELPGLPSLEGL